LQFLPAKGGQRRQPLNSRREKMDETLKLKVSDKGAVSVYGLQRFPVTLYGEQWLRLLEEKENIEAFIAKNQSKLKVKGE
jgi:hypothetical protein